MAISAFYHQLNHSEIYILYSVLNECIACWKIRLSEIIARSIESRSHYNRVKTADPQTKSRSSDPWELCRDISQSPNIANKCCKSSTYLIGYAYETKLHINYSYLSRGAPCFVTSMSLHSDQSSPIDTMLQYLCWKLLRADSCHTWGHKHSVSSPVRTSN